MSDAAVDISLDTATQPTGDTAGQATETTNKGTGLPGGDNNTALPGGDGVNNAPDDSDDNIEPTGAPEKYEAFDISAGEDIGYTLTDAQREKFEKFGQDNKLTQETMNALVQFDIERARELNASNDQFIKDYLETGIKETRKLYGEKYAEQYAKNGKVFNKFFPEEARKNLNDSGISGQPWFAQILQNIGNAISEDVTVPNEGGKDPSERTLEDFFKQ